VSSFPLSYDTVFDLNFCQLLNIVLYDTDTVLIFLLGNSTSSATPGRLDGSGLLLVEPIHTVVEFQSCG
jgi:hypothetical protein